MTRKAVSEADYSSFELPTSGQVRLDWVCGTPLGKHGHWGRNALCDMVFSTFQDRDEYLDPETVVCAACPCCGELVGDREDDHLDVIFGPGDSSYDYDDWGDEEYEEGEDE